MHSIAREGLQSYLYSYKQSPKETGLALLRDAKQTNAVRKVNEADNALKCLRASVKLKVAFAVKTSTSYDGALENQSPLQAKTISFHKNDFLHIYKRYNYDWWIGRVVGPRTTIGFIPTARRLSRLQNQADDEIDNKNKGKRLVASQSSIWECPNPYTVVPSTRPIVLLGPCFQNSRLNELMHAAVRAAIVDQFGNRVRRLTSDIGMKDTSKMAYDLNECELRTITALSEDLHLVLLQSPNINTPTDIAGIHLAPIFILIRINNKKILMKLLKKSGIKGGNELANSDVINSVGAEQVDILIEENGLPEATRRVCSALEEYWHSLHPNQLLESSYLDETQS